MNLKILGSISPYPKLYKNCPGYLVVQNQEKILIDCGNGISRLLNFPNDLNNLTVIISHLHKDHYADLTSLAYASYVYNNLGLLKDRIKVYLPYPNLKEEIIDYNYLVNFQEHFLEFVPYSDSTSINTNDIGISFCKNPHPVTTFSVKIKYKDKTLVYSSDTGYKNNCLTEFARSADLLICESTFLKYQKNSDNHLSAYEAGLIAKEAGVSQLLLTHFWPEIDGNVYLDEAKNIFENVMAAEEEKVIKIGGKIK